MNIIHKLRFKYSEPYRIKMGCGLSPIRNNREYKALMEFCKQELEDKPRMKLNPTRRKVYEATLELDSLETPEGFWFKLPHRPKQYYNEVYSFIEDHVGWYWN